MLLEQCGEVLSRKISNSETQMRCSQPTQESRCTKVWLLQSSPPSLPNRLIPQWGYIRIVSARTVHIPWSTLDFCFWFIDRIICRVKFCISGIVVILKISKVRIMLSCRNANFFLRIFAARGVCVEEHHLPGRDCGLWRNWSLDLLSNVSFHQYPPYCKNRGTRH